MYTFLSLSSLIFLVVSTIATNSNIPSAHDVLSSSNFYESYNNSYTLSSYINNTVITVYGPKIPDIQLRLILPPIMNSSWCTSTNYYSGNYDSNLINKNNNDNIVTGILFFDDQQQFLNNNCSLNEIIYNAYYNMFQSSPFYLLFPEQYEKEFQNEINLHSYSIEHFTDVPPTILFVPYGYMKMLATELKEREVKGEDSMKEEELSYQNTYYILPIPNTYYSNDQPNNNTDENIGISARTLCILFIAAICLLGITLSLNSSYDNNEPTYTSIAGGRVILQPQNTSKKQQIHLVTYGEFLSLPRIHYNKFDMSYSQRRRLMMMKNKEEIYLDQNRLTATDHTGSKIPVAAVADVDVMKQQIDGRESMIDIVVATDSSNKNNNARSNLISSNNNNLDTNSSHHHNTHCGGIVNETCAICIDEFQNYEHVILLPRCQHIYHIECIELWLLNRKSNICPLCKLEVLEQKNHNKQKAINTIEQQLLMVPNENTGISDATTSATLHVQEDIVAIHPVTDII